MRPYCPKLLFVIPVFFVLHNHCVAQDGDVSSLSTISAKYFDAVSKRSDAISEKIAAKTTKSLKQLQKREEKIKRKLYKIDSLAASNVFNTAEQRYKALEQKLNSPGKLTQYIPFLDTLKTSLKFLDKNKEFLSKTGELQSKMDGALGKVNNLESKIQKAEYVKQFLKEQKQFLNSQLEKFGFANQLKKLNKDVYYYSQQIAEYKETIKDTKKMERKAIDLISQTKLFQGFMKKNSMLASLFRMPADDPNDPAYLQSLAGLQTRAQINQLMQNQLGTGPNALQQLQSSVQQAQGQMQQMKDKMAQYGTSSSDEEIPDFKPNQQKTKSVLKRLELGTNTQSQRSNGLLPVTSDIGASLGYKLNDRSVIGVGASYKMGWGNNIRHLKISHQGAGLRSFIDWKITSPFAGNLKTLIGSLWLSGGYEMNYHSEFKKLEQLKQFSSWQRSGLIGLTKKFSINTKFFKNTKLQLLWDLLSYSQVPRTQPLIFRIGYDFK